MGSSFRRSRHPGAGLALTAPVHAAPTAVAVQKGTPPLCAVLAGVALVARTARSRSAVALQSRGHPALRSHACEAVVALTTRPSRATRSWQSEGSAAPLQSGPRKALVAHALALVTAAAAVASVGTGQLATVFTREALVATKCR